MKRSLYVLVLLSIVAGGSAVAQIDETTLAKCVEHAQANDAAVADCYGIAYDAADRRMNQAYAQLKRRLDPAAFAKVQASQRAWLKFRDANREAMQAAGPGGYVGTLDSAIQRSREYDLVVFRANELEGWLEDWAE